MRVATIIIRLLTLLLLCLGLPACVVAPQAKFGVQDEQVAKSIERANTLSSLRGDQQFEKIITILNNDLARFKQNNFASSRIRNELADIYTYQLLDIESAIALDEQLTKEALSELDESGEFVPRHMVAKELTLADKGYLDRFIRPSSDTIRKLAKQRLENNLTLLAGGRQSGRNSYDLTRLKYHIATVSRDIARTAIGSPERIKLYSRFIRAEYEIFRLDNNFKFDSNKFFSDGNLSPNRIDLTEIDYLSLADYFIQIFKQTGNITYAEYALQTVYRPYVNLRSSLYRWQYNKLINDYIGMLVEANYQAGRYDDTLYYASLNKSRMLLEERLAFAKNGANAKVSDLAGVDGIPRTAAGLPEKAWFQRKLAATDGYLDFYIAGSYDTQKTGNSKVAMRAERSTMPLTTRDFGVEYTNDKEDVFVDDALYVMRVEGGRVVSVKKTSGTRLSSLKSELDSAYRQIANPREGKAPASRQLQELAGGNSKQLMVSPDKWMARHPLDYHLGVRVTRSVNFFTAADQGKVRDLRASGFFNPTLDLPGAEQEAEAMRTVLPSLQTFTREQATLSALERAADASIVHLSMHGQFNADEPTSSRLAFAGARSGRGVLSDPNSLYAKDMYKYAALKDRDLVFAAACQAGLSAADQSNQSELMGILRPLTANRNRNIILSLWNVNDAATRDFVGSFYKHLAANRDVAESFHAAQDELRQKYPDPYYWAAFYLAQAR